MVTLATKLAAAAHLEALLDLNSGGHAGSQWRTGRSSASGLVAAMKRCLVDLKKLGAASLGHKGNNKAEALTVTG